MKTFIDIRGAVLLAAVFLAIAVLSGESAARDKTAPPKEPPRKASSMGAKGGAQAAGEVPKKPVTVTSDRMEANKNDNVVVFRGNVTAVEDFTLCSDELYIHYDDHKEVSLIEAGGNVRIFQEDKTSTSGKAVYDRKQRTIVLTGSPQVRQCGDTVKGDRITVYMDQDNALVESGNGGRVRAVIMPEKKCPEGTPAEKGISEEARCKGSR